MSKSSSSSLDSLPEEIHPTLEGYSLSVSPPTLYDRAIRGAFLKAESRTIHMTYYTLYFGNGSGIHAARTHCVIFFSVSGNLEYTAETEVPFDYSHPVDSILNLQKIALLC